MTCKDFLSRLALLLALAVSVTSWTACQKKARDRAQDETVWKQIWEEAEAKDAKNYDVWQCFDERISFCKSRQKSLRGEFKRRCDALPETRWNHFLEQAKGATYYNNRLSATCDRVVPIAAAAGKQAEGETFCADWEIANHMGISFESARSELKSNHDKVEFPPDCETPKFERLRALKSPFLREAVKQLGDLCFKQLAKKILELAAKKDYCPDSALALLKSLRAGNGDPKPLDPLVPPVMKRCKKELDAK